MFLSGVPPRCDARGHSSFGVVAGDEWGSSRPSGRAVDGSGRLALLLLRQTHLGKGDARERKWKEITMTGDARPIPFSVWRKIAMASWRPRKDPAILATIDVDAGALLGYIDDVRAATGAHVTPVHLVGRAGREGLRGASRAEWPRGLRPVRTLADDRLLLRRVVAHRSDRRHGRSGDRSLGLGRPQRRPEAAVGHRARARRSGGSDPGRPRPAVQADQTDGQVAAATRPPRGDGRHRIRHRGPAASDAVHRTRRRARTGRSS